MPARKPTKTLELSGAMKRNPGRYANRKNEPKPDGPLGEPSTRLNKMEKEAWREIANNLPPGVATNADRIAMEHLARLVAKMWKEGLGGRYGLSVGEQSVMMQLCVRFGMLPADRSKISVPPNDDNDNPFAEFTEKNNADGKRPN